VTESWKLGTVVASSNSLAVQSRFGRQATKSLSYPYRRPYLPAADAAGILCFCTKFCVLKHTILLHYTVTRSIAALFVVEYGDDGKRLKNTLFICVFTYVFVGYLMLLLQAVSRPMVN
jgi:hypothetical protein